MTEQSALTQYGERQQIRELADRIKMMLPQVRLLGETGSIALAQIAHSLGLNPFTGEVWAIPQGGKNFSLMVGIKGLRRAAKNQAKAMGGLYPYYRTNYRMLSDDEKDMASIGPNDKAIVCQVEVFLVHNHPFYQTNNHERCIYEGIGIVRAGTKSKMEPIQLVRKRAEADALKQAFDLPFGESIDDESYSINGEYSAGRGWDSVPETIDAETGEIVEEPELDPDIERDVISIQEQRTNGKHKTNGSKRPLDPFVLKAFLKQKERSGGTGPATKKQIPFLARKFQECFAGDGDAELKYHSCLRWLWDTGSAKNLTLGQAKATLDWLLAAEKDETGDIPLHEHASEEAQRVLRQAMKDAGQQELFNTDEENAVPWGIDYDEIEIEL